MSVSDPLRVLIVDDEAPARRRLRRMLSRAAFPVAVEGEAADAVEALAWLAEHEVDLVFVDINMPGLDGLAFAKVARLPQFVFVTAHDEHAVEAFELGAIDYLLKPFSRERLDACLARARERHASSHSAEALHAALAQADRHRAASAATSAAPVRLAARHLDTTRLYDVREISRLWASEKYAAFCVDGREQLLDQSLSELERRLADHGFLRVHRKALVNLAHVLAVQHEGKRMVLEMTDGARVEVSRRLASTVRERLGL